MNVAHCPHSWKVNRGETEVQEKEGKRSSRVSKPVRDRLTPRRGPGMGDKSNMPQFVRGLHAEKGQPQRDRRTLCRELKQGDGGGRDGLSGLTTRARLEGEGDGWVAGCPEEPRQVAPLCGPHPLRGSLPFSSVLPHSWLSGALSGGKHWGGRPPGA